MNSTNVPTGSEPAPSQVLQSIASQLPELTPQLRKAAAYVLENPNDVGVSSIREIADAADVKPNTFVRMARNFGFDGYDDFREPFREEIRRGGSTFPDRARWLQSVSRSHRHGGLFADMAASALQNIEQTFAATSAEQIKCAADAVVAANRTYVLGVGINHTLARNFEYLADMALDNVIAIPRDGGLAIDELAKAGEGDVLIAITFKPYRTDVLKAFEIARQQGVCIIGLSDSPASPLVAGSDFGFVVETDTPQFFTSTFAANALLDTLMAFVIADAGPDVVRNIESFHRRRVELGIYQDDSST